MWLELTIGIIVFFFVIGIIFSFIKFSLKIATSILLVIVVLFIASYGSVITTILPIGHTVLFVHDSNTTYKVDRLYNAIDIRAIQIVPQEKIDAISSSADTVLEINSNCATDLNCILAQVDNPIKVYQLYRNDDLTILKTNVFLWGVNVWKTRYDYLRTQWLS
jgi:hypothetical protein